MVNPRPVPSSRKVWNYSAHSQSQAIPVIYEETDDESAAHIQYEQPIPRRAPWFGGFALSAPALAPPGTRHSTPGFSSVLSNPPSSQFQERALFSPQSVASTAATSILDIENIPTFNVPSPHIPQSIEDSVKSPRARALVSERKHREKERGSFADLNTAIESTGRKMVDKSKIGTLAAAKDVIYEQVAESQIHSARIQALEAFTADLNRQINELQFQLQLARNALTALPAPTPSRVITSFRVVQEMEE